MQATVIKELSASEVNYDEAPLLTLEVEGIEYRVDTGYLSAVAISQREPDSSGNSAAIRSGKSAAPHRKEPAR